MKTMSQKTILLGGIFMAIGIVLGLIVDEVLISQILVVLGIEIIIFELVRKYIFKKSSIKILGVSILFFSILNILRHSTFFFIISRLKEFYENSIVFNQYLFRESIWLIASIWILGKGIQLIKNEKEKEFKEYVKSQEFKIITALIIIILFLEIPIFGIHGGFGGGLHGHGFWDKGLHMH